MLNKLRQIKERFNEVELALNAPDIYARQDEMRSLLSERKSLAPLVDAIDQYFSMLSELEASEAMATDASIDQDLRALAREECLSLKSSCEQIRIAIEQMLIPKDPDDEKNVVVEIRAGTGGEEAALFAADLFRMYRMYAEKNRIAIEVVNANETELGGYKEITFLMEGKGVFGRFKFESGVHRVQRVPETESQGRIQTSAVTVAVLPEAKEVEISISPSDVRIESCKSSGAGGQHVNKTESAVRLTHIPTGIVVECQEERSQHKNRDKAMKLLRTKLYQIRQKEQTDAIATERRNQVGTGDRSEKIRTYHFPQNRVTDHRISLTLYSLRNFLDGDLDQMMDALAASAAADKLKGQDSTL